MTISPHYVTGNFFSLIYSKYGSSSGERKFKCLKILSYVLLLPNSPEAHCNQNCPYLHLIYMNGTLFLDNIFIFWLNSL